MGRSRLLAVFVAAFCLATGASAQEPEEASAEEPKVDAFQYFFGSREEPAEEPAEAAAPVGPEAKKDAFQYLFGRRGPAEDGQEEAAVPEAPVKPMKKEEPARVERAREKPAREKPAKPAPVAPEAPKAEPKPEPAEVAPSALPEEPKADAFQYFFGPKKTLAEPAEAGADEKEEGEAEKPPQ
ncbi:MAG TPA: hypothetical protein VHN15_05605 [Thermoanaerobaculia bacterium]|nr:hypothetical protein [Thermoanaerobaculia bacterium]